MARIRLEHKTSLSAIEIKERAEKLVGEALGKYKEHISEVHQGWEGNVLSFAFKVKGFSVSGKLTTEDKRIIIEAKIPLVAGIFKGKIKKGFQARAEALFP